MHYEPRPLTGEERKKAAGIGAGVGAAAAAVVGLAAWYVARLVLRRAPAPEGR